VPDELDEFATHRSSKSAYWKFPRRDAAGHGGGGGITGGAGGAGGATPPPADGAGGATPPPADGAGGDDFKSEQSEQAVLTDLAAARRERDEALAKLAAIDDASKTEEQRQAEAAKQQAADLAAAQLKNAQYDAADAAGLPIAYAKRIVGATAEEMAADAKALKADLDKQVSSGQRTDGAGASDAGGSAEVSPGMGRLEATYSTSNSNK
jgi:hypothetical protein